MVALMAADLVLTNPERRVVYDPSRRGYGFYVKYRSYIPMEHLAEIEVEGVGLQLADPVEMEARIMALDVWVPIRSPAVSFPNKSLVYVQGRMILPAEGSADDDEDESIFVLHIEVIFAHFRRSLASARWTFILLWENPRPQVTIIGEVLEINEVEGDNNPVTLLIESKVDVAGGVERQRVGILIPPYVHMPPNLMEGSWTIAVGKLIPLVYANIYLVMEVTVIRLLMTDGE